MRFAKVYLEISNVCNLSCAFCPGTRRQKRVMDEEAFASLLPKLRPYTDFLYFHLMGEPLLHPKLDTFLKLAGDAGFKVILTTNGTLLQKQQEILLNAPALHKVNISLHALKPTIWRFPSRYIWTAAFLSAGLRRAASWWPTGCGIRAVRTPKTAKFWTR